MLLPGDLISVEPSSISTLRAPKSKAGASPDDAVSEVTEAESAESSEATSNASTTSTSTPPAPPSGPAKKPLPFELPEFASPFLFVPPYLEVSWPTCSAVYLRHPTAAPGISEVPSPYEADGEVMRLAWVSETLYKQALHLPVFRS